MARLGESVFHLTLHTAEFRLAPVLICKRGCICIHQDSPQEARRDQGIFSSRTSKQRQQWGTPEVVGWWARAGWKGVTATGEGRPESFLE